MGRLVIGMFSDRMFGDGTFCLGTVFYLLLYLNLVFCYMLFFVQRILKEMQHYLNMPQPITIVRALTLDNLNYYLFQVCMYSYA